MKLLKSNSLFFWALSMVFITIPFPKYSMNSQAIIFLILVWLLQGGWNRRLNRLKLYKWQLISVSILFFIPLFGLLFTEDLDNGFKVLKKQLVFLIIPLIIFTSQLDKSCLKKILDLFSVATIVASAFALIKAYFFKVNNLGEFFYYSEFSKLLDVHSTYFATFINVSIIHLLILFIKLKREQYKKKGVITLGVLFLCGILYILSSRISIVILFFSIVYIILYYRFSIKKVYLILTLGIAFLTLIAFFSSPNFQKRSSGISEFGTSTPSLDTRFLHWQAVLTTIQKNNMLVGNGTGDGQEGLLEAYLEVNFKDGYRYKYNAHNQYLEQILSYGILGLISLLCLLLYGFIQSWKVNNPYGVVFIINFSTVMLTESFLYRHNGIVLFACFVSLIFYENQLLGLKK